MKSRKQVRLFVKGDRIEATSTGAYEVVEIQLSEDGSFVIVRVRPVPCGAECGKNCECHFSLFEGIEHPVVLRLRSQQRLPFLGNIPQMEAETARMQEQLALLRGETAVESQHVPTTQDDTETQNDKD